MAKNDEKKIKRSFDPRSDLRLAMAVYAVDVLDSLARDGKIPGIRKQEAVELLERISSCINKMRESTMSKHMLLISNLFRGFNNLLSTFISRLGINWYRVAKMKDDYTAKLLRFAIFNLRSLGTRLKKYPDGSPLGTVKISFVRVLEAKKHPRDPKYKIAKVTDMEMIYEVITDADIQEKSVVLFAHTPPIRVKGFVSEGVILKDDNGNVITGSDEDIGQSPTELPESVEKQIGDIVIKLLEEEFLI
ncbi:MAG: hypothetical protein ACTSVA_01440 [Candidatus Njordarchaeales archaeon]